MGLSDPKTQTFQDHERPIPWQVKRRTLHLFTAVFSMTVPNRSIRSNGSRGAMIEAAQIHNIDFSHPTQVVSEQSSVCPLRTWMRQNLRARVIFHMNQQELGALSSDTLMTLTNNFFPSSKRRIGLTMTGKSFLAFDLFCLLVFPIFLVMVGLSLEPMVPSYLGTPFLIPHMEEVAPVMHYLLHLPKWNLLTTCLLSRAVPCVED